MPANERSDGIYVATSPNRTPEGRFYEENVVASDILADHVRQWAPTSALYAGTYCWTVSTSNRDTFESAFSEPISFRIAVQGGVRSLRVRRTSYTFFPDELDISVTWRANTRQVSVAASLFRRGKQVWRVRESTSARRHRPFSPPTSSGNARGESAPARGYDWS